MLYVVTIIVQNVKYMTKFGSYPTDFDGRNNCFKVLDHFNKTT